MKDNNKIKECIFVVVVQNEMKRNGMIFFSFYNALDTYSFQKGTNVNCIFCYCI